MADPITGWVATGAAASVIQIIDLAARLAKETYELMNSADNSLKENKVVEELTVTYENLADQILALDDPSSTLDKAEQAINDLARECKKVSSDLLKLLHELQIPKGSNGPRRAWESARKAQRSMQKRNSIEQKQKYLNGICGQLSTAMLMQLKRGRVADLEHVFSRLSDTETQNASLVMQAKDTILSAIEGDTSKKKCGLILNSLWFREMSLRRNAIPKAYEETFSWIFAEASPFHSWLTSDKDIFWITGKAGSGKSTLMKFAGEDMRTQSLLSGWAGKNELVITRNYFWNPGLTMQRNEEGMLQEILFQILDSHPDLVTIATPGRWKSDLVRLGRTEPWSKDELMHALMSVFEYTNGTTSYCLFVDGLDEYEGEHSRLVSAIASLSRYSNVKICLSSRSWNVFFNAFDHLEDKIYLHALTRPDIDIYVRRKVGKFLGATALADELSSAIIDKAQGVFFWVFLVVRSLREGYEEGDDADIMRQRIDEFPSDLEDYFRHILKRLSPIYRKRTVKALSLAIRILGQESIDDDEIEDSNSFLSFWLLSMGHIDTQKGPFELPLRPSVHREIRDMVKSTRQFLKACSRDFLHMERDRVEFLHRTVYDFLYTSEVQCLLEKDTPSHFQSAMFPAEVALARHKMMEFGATEDSFRLHPKLIYSVIKSVVSDDRSHMLMLQYEKLFTGWLTSMPRYSTGVNSLGWKYMANMCVALSSHNLHNLSLTVLNPSSSNLISIRNWPTDPLYIKNILAAVLGVSGLHSFPAYEVDLSVLRWLLGRETFKEALVRTHAKWIKEDVELNATSWSTSQTKHAHRVVEALLAHESKQVELPERRKNERWLNVADQISPSHPHSA